MKPNTLVLGFYDQCVPDDCFLCDPAFQDTKENDHYGVAIVSDTLKMQKNVCLARYISAMSKKDLFTIDVRPLDLLRPDSSHYVDVCSLFLLQMACVLTMVFSWKAARLRIFLCIESGDESWVKEEEKLQELLDKLRIKATIKIVIWDEVVALHWRRQLSPQEQEAGRDFCFL